MKQVVQSTAGGPVRVIDVPRPTIAPTEVLVQTVASVISPGTERAVTRLAQSSLLAKARTRPDLVREVVRRAKRDGVADTVRKVQARLDADVPLGYSAAGIAVEVGEHVAGIRPGQLVATAGAGKANHAEYQAVPGLLCAPVPDGVAAEDAAFATIAAIALHGLRLADVQVGSRVVVVGLGLVGQLAVRLAQASGCEVAGIDVADFPVDKAQRAGALAMLERGEETTGAVLDWSRGRGADAVLVTAGGASSDAIMRTSAIARDRATVVVVGDVGLELERTPFYSKEISIRFARSYGPGRYERSYEDWGVDYPAGLVRWTEGRNLEAVLDLLASGRLQVADLVTHTFPIEGADDAYSLIEQGTEPYLGVRLAYPSEEREERPVRLSPAKISKSPGIGLIGAGAFPRDVLIPAFREAGFERFVAVSSASGLSAVKFAERAGFEKATDDVISDPDVEVVVIATRHDTHAELTAKALRAGKHVFCEKPLALSEEELDAVEAAWRESGRVLFVGFNRRWSPAVTAVRKHFQGRTGPLTITYRVVAGELPDDHWYNDVRQGGRLLGEACHFVDTCAAIVGVATSDVRAVGSYGNERLLANHLAVSLSYPDGSVASISHSHSGHHSTSKERIEVHGRAHSALIDDFREVELDGERRRVSGKGHREEARAFLRAVRTGDSEPALSAIATTRSTLQAASRLIRGA